MSIVMATFIDENDGTVGVKLDFQPPINTTTTALTPAQHLALVVLEQVQARLCEEGGDDV